MGRHRREEVGDPEFRLLFVCTGNVCRSPFADILTRHLLIGRLGGRAAGQFRVSSAGVQAVAGGAMNADRRAQLAPWGLDRAIAARFVARQLTSDMVDEAHLVLGASPRHRSAVVQLAPAALTTAFSVASSPGWRTRSIPSYFRRIPSPGRTRWWKRRACSAVSRHRADPPTIASRIR